MGMKRWIAMGIEKLPERLRETRGAILQDKFAEMIGVSRASLSYYENGRRTPDIETLKRIYEVTGVSVYYLLGIAGTRKDMPMDGGMTMDAYQIEARRTVHTHEKLDEALLGLPGEVGELCDHYKKAVYQGHEFNRDHMIEEAGDALFYLAELCDGLGVKMSEVARRNISKRYRRYPEGFSAERSLNREGEKHGEDHD